MNCYCLTTTPPKYCYTIESGGGTACPECLGFVGSKIKKEVALSSGYDLTKQDGDTTEYQCVEYSKLVKLKIVLHNHSKIGLKIGFKTMPYSSGKVYVLFCPYCDEQIGQIPEYFIEWAKQSSDARFAAMAASIKDLTPLQPVFIPKIPSPFFCDYQDYIHSKQWQRKRNERLALDRKQCVLCFSMTNLHVHHVTYERLFKEKMSDLMTVCKECHEIIHNRFFDGE
jgi:hypothetical protein